MIFDVSRMGQVLMTAVAEIDAWHMKTVNASVNLPRMKEMDQDMDALTKVTGSDLDQITTDLTPLERIASALERISPAAVPAPDLSQHEAFIWQVEPDRLQPVDQVNRIPLELLVGIDRTRDTLLSNTRRFAKGLGANNALLWGARGMGKSSLVKAVHGALCKEGLPLVLVELQREDLPSVGRLLDILRKSDKRIILYCDDLSFGHDDQHYKSLKAVLDGGISGRPSNVIFYATSNRRHLMPRDMIENERQSGINPSEAVEEKVSLSDRFGRGSRSGRVAWQFFIDLASRHGVLVD
jgi:predicted AAA+ superfamily ATPase